MVFLLCLRLMVRVGWRWVPEDSCEPENITQDSIIQPQWS